MLETTVAGEPAGEFARRLLATDFLLWSPNIQAEAFLNWDRIWATRRIAKGKPKPLPRRPDLPDFTFDNHGAVRTIEDLMRWEFVSGLLVVKDGEVRLERYGMGLDPKRCWQSSSMVKSLASILVGMAVHDGAIKGIDQDVVDYIPELKETAYDGVTIRHLLLMASGVYWTEITDDLTTDVTAHYIRPIAQRRPNYIIEYLKTRARADPPGARFYYNSSDTYLLSLVLSRATGVTVADYCSEKLWKPMGFEQDGFFMLDAENGHEVTGSCCGASLRDYARWGLLMLADGIVDGVRILPEGWVRESTRPASPGFEFYQDGNRGKNSPERKSRFKGYGFLWWIREDGDYQALGSFGQWIYVSPANNVVVVILGAIPRHVYMTSDELALHKDTSHAGSEMRLDFTEAVMNRVV
jgi:CubicO group peptidase (beta-lactamase class C family)